METANATQLLKSIGISSNMILLFTAVGVAFYAYRNYYETVKLKYEIQALKEQTEYDPKIFK